MLRGLILVGCLLVIALSVFTVEFPKGLVAISVVSVIAVAIIFAMRRFSDEPEFLTWVFLGALVLRLGFGLFVEVFDLRMFFGSDALAYDRDGLHLLNVWAGNAEVSGALFFQAGETGATFWGIYYFTAIIYYIFGHNFFAAQSIVAIIGAATAPMVFLCAREIFANIRVAKFAAVSLAVFPSVIVWSGQLLKDGLIIFLLVTAMVMVLRLQKKFSYPDLAVLLFSLLGILSIRFYIFYMVVVAVTGSFVVGLSNTKGSFLRNAVILAAVGLALVYMGVSQRAVREYQAFGNLERVQLSRLDLSQSESGFGAEVDVSTTEGAISSIPLGFVYLMFAPFPWEVTNLRQAITLPEVLVWWASMPLLIVGLIYTVRHRIRSAFPILIFSLLLTIAYSIFQGNVGTAYRQRTQIQVFLFILIGVGWTVLKEKRENEKIIRQAAQHRMETRLREARLANTR